MSKRTVRETELSYKFRFKILDLLGSLFSLLIPWGGLCYISYKLFGTLDTYSGKYTFADIGIRFLGELKISEGLAYLLATGGIIYGWGEKRLRQKTIEQLSGRPIELEKRIDPRRSSSGLTPQGTTRPEDIP